MVKICFHFVATHRFPPYQCPVKRFILLYGCVIGKNKQISGSTTAHLPFVAEETDGNSDRYYVLFGQGIFTCKQYTIHERKIKLFLFQIPQKI